MQFVAPKEAAPNRTHLHACPCLSWGCRTRSHKLAQYLYDGDGVHVHSQH
jgi:hypothetical protein